MSKGSGKPSMTKNDGSGKGSKGGGKGGGRGPDRARQIAAQKLAEQKRKQRLITGLVTGGIGLVVVAVAAFVAISVIVASQPVPPPKGGDETSIIVGKPAAKVTVDLYVDFQCPGCKNFETANKQQLAKFAADGTAKLKYHPLGFLDAQSGGNRYSSRASSASACVANLSGAPAFEKFKDILFDNQPPEGGSGMEDAQLIAFASQAGASSTEIQNCIKQETYKGWTQAVTTAAGKAGVQQTPTVKVNNKDVADTSAQGIAKAINDAAKA